MIRRCSASSARRPLAAGRHATEGTSWAAPAFWRPVGSDDGTSAMDEEAKQIIRERAHALWEADGRPEGRDLAYWLRAEQELLAALVAGEEDPSTRG